MEENEAPVRILRACEFVGALSLLLFLFSLSLSLSLSFFAFFLHQAVRCAASLCGPHWLVR
jgi:hypothetical protein